MRARTPKPASPTPSELVFFIPGIAKTAGSKRAFMPKGARFPIVVDDSGVKGKDWRGDCKRFAMDAIADLTGYPLTGALDVSLRFVMARPKGDLRKDGTPKPNAPHWHVKKPDALKMARAVEDALTGIVWHDDSQIAVEHLSKVYGTNPGCEVRIVLLEPQRGNSSQDPDLLAHV